MKYLEYVTMKYWLMKNNIANASMFIEAQDKTRKQYRCVFMTMLNTYDGVFLQWLI